jgi:hypothetical protein
MAYKKLSPAEAAVHNDAMKHMLPFLDNKKNFNKLKSLLPENLQGDFAFCYWAADNCYYCCGYDGNWYKVKCM